MDHRDAARPPSLVLDWLRAGPHDSLLAVGENGARLANTLAGDAIPSRLHVAELPTATPRAWLQALASHARFDAAVLSSIVETLPEADSAAVLASVRDVIAGRFVLLIEQDTPVALPDMLALGLRTLGTVRVGGVSLHACGYDLASYKRTPDWLNPGGWAHPQNWGRYRW